MSTVVFRRKIQMSDKQDSVVPYDLGFSWDTVAAPLLLQYCNQVFLAIEHVVVTSKADPRVSGVGVVEMQCDITSFGYPNDEALPGHPLYRARR